MDGNTEVKELLNLVNSRLQRIETLLQSRIIPEYLTLKETAEYLKVSVRTIRRLIDSGEFIYYRIGDGKTSKIVLSKKDVDNYTRGTG